jgi:hypothetical protein
LRRRLFEEGRYVWKSAGEPAQAGGGAAGERFRPGWWTGASASTFPWAASPMSPCRSWPIWGLWPRCTPTCFPTP